MEMHTEQLLATDDPQQAFDIIQTACNSMYDADQMLQHLDLSIDQKALEKVQQEIQKQESNETQLVEAEEPTEPDSALQVMSGLFEDLGASWIIVEAVFKDSAVTDVVNICNNRSFQSLPAPPEEE